MFNLDNMLQLLELKIRGEHILIDRTGKIVFTGETTEDIKNYLVVYCEGYLAGVKYSMEVFGV